MCKFIWGCAGSSLLHGVSLDMESRDRSLDLVHGLLIAVASLVAELRLQGTWASVKCGTQAQQCGSRTLEDSLNCCGKLA